MTPQEQDNYWMKKVLTFAQKAMDQNEVPIGALIVDQNNKLVASAFNQKESLQSCIAHAEILAIHRASKKLKNWRLENCTLYVNVEPCSMCASALLQSRIGRIVYGCSEPKMGAIQSKLSLLELEAYSWRPDVKSGVLAEESTQMMTSFFSNLRNQKADLIKEREVTAVFVFHNDKLLGFTGVDPTSKVSHFFLPGGKVEHAESPIETGIRETLEETGYKIQIFEDSYFYREYLYPWDGQTYRRKTHFFVGILNQEWHPPVRQQDADYNLGPSWISVDEIPKKLNYHSAISMAANKAMKFWKRKQRSHK